MKKFLYLTFILMTLLTVTVITTVASDGTVDSISYSFDEQSGTLTFSGKGAMPDYGNEYERSSAPWDSFCTDVQTVVIGDGITRIGSGTFYNFENLTDIRIADSVTEIGDNAFDDCYSLSRINLPDSVTHIGRGVFYKCESLTEINIPKGITSIGSVAFYECRNLKTVNLPDGITEIGDSAFYGCSNLESIALPDGLTRIGNAAFFRCAKLKDIHAIPTGLTDLGSRAFDGCRSLETDIVIPGSITKIPYLAFNECVSVRNLTLPDNLTEIGYGAFTFCESLTELKIPSSVTKIDYAAFSSCSNLEGEFIIPDGIEEIPDYAFAGCEKLVSIHIPDSVMVIGKYAFERCSNLEKITIPWNITNIKACAFGGCPKLSINVDENNRHYTSIDGSLYSKDTTTLFAYCVTDADVSLPEGITEINNYAFYRNTALKEIVIPDGVVCIGYNAFSGCKNLEMVTLPNSLSILDSRAFDYGCENLTDIYYQGNNMNIVYILQKSCNATIHYDKTNTISVFVNNRHLSFDQAPFVKDGHIMVPLRAVFEELGARVFWKLDTQTVTATKDDTSFSLNIGDNVLYKDGQKIELGTEALLHNMRTYIPYNIIWECFDCDVTWNGENNAVMITADLSSVTKPRPYMYSN